MLYIQQLLYYGNERRAIEISILLKDEIKTLKIVFKDHLKEMRKREHLSEEYKDNCIQLYKKYIKKEKLVLNLKKLNRDELITLNSVVSHRREIEKKAKFSNKCLYLMKRIYSRIKEIDNGQYIIYRLIELFSCGNGVRTFKNLKKLKEFQEFKTKTLDKIHLHFKKFVKFIGKEKLEEFIKQEK